MVACRTANSLHRRASLLDKIDPTSDMKRSQMFLRRMPHPITDDFPSDKSRSRYSGRKCPLQLGKRTSELRTVMPALGHVWTAPGWQGESSLCSIGRSSHVFGLFARYS